MQGTAAKRNRTQSNNLAKRSKSTKDSRRKTNVPRTVSQGKQAFAKQQTATLTYAEQVAIAPASGAYTEYKFSANGLYDPNLTGTGHQPLYFDQLMLIYNHYCVTQSKITIVINPPVPAAATITAVLFTDDDTSTNTTSIQGAIERPGSVFSICQGATSMFTPSYLQKTWMAKNVFAGNPLSRDELHGNAGANPTEETEFILAMADAVGATNTSIATVKIEYTATFYELKSISSS